MRIIAADTRITVARILFMAPACQDRTGRLFRPETVLVSAFYGEDGERTSTSSFEVTGTLLRKDLTPVTGKHSQTGMKLMDSELHLLPRAIADEYHGMLLDLPASTSTD